MIIIDNSYDGIKGKRAEYYYKIIGGKYDIEIRYY